MPRSHWRNVAILALLALGVTTMVGRGAALKESGGSIRQVRVVSSNDGFSFSQFGSDGTWQDVPGAKLNVTVPKGTDALLLIRFSAESYCASYSYGEDSNSPASGYCPVRILVNGVQAQPADGSDFAFDSTNMGNDYLGSWEAHAMERWFFADAGTYEVKVQATVRSSVGAETLAFRLDDWILVVERAKK